MKSPSIRMPVRWLSAAALAFTVTLAPSPASANANRILVVDINDPGNFSQIQEAVDAAAPGDHIMIHSGTYTPVLVEKEGLTFAPANAHAVPVIDAAGGQFGMWINADDVTVRGLVALNASDTEGYCFFSTGSNNTFAGNRSEGGVHGFGAGGGSDNVWIGNTASGNEFGFEIGGETAPRLVGNNAEENFIGVLLGGCSGGLLAANTANTNFVGVFLPECSDLEVIANEANGNGLDGLNLLDCSGMTVASNQANDNGRHGCRVRLVTDSIFTATVVNGNAVNGVALDDESGFGSAGNRFLGTSANHNGAWGVFVGEASTDNVFRGTRGKGNELGLSNPEPVLSQSPLHR